MSSQRNVLYHTKIKVARVSKHYSKLIHMLQLSSSSITRFSYSVQLSFLINSSRKICIIVHSSCICICELKHDHTKRLITLCIRRFENDLRERQTAARPRRTGIVLNTSTYSRADKRLDFRRRKQKYIALIISKIYESRPKTRLCRSYCVHMHVQWIELQVEACKIERNRGVSLLRLYTLPIQIQRPLIQSPDASCGCGSGPASSS